MCFGWLSKLLLLLYFSHVVGVLEVEFDDELYITQTMGTCLDWSCADESDPEPCDYTDPRVCQGLVPGCDNSSMICALLEEYPVQILRPNEEISMYLGPAEETWFIMHVNKTYDCFMNYITLRSDYGEPDLIIWTKDSFDGSGDPIVFADTLGWENALLCPADVGIGTFVIQVYSYQSFFAATGVGTQFQLKWTPTELRNPSPPSSPCTLPPELQQDIVNYYGETQHGHFCIQDGQRVELSHTDYPLSEFYFAMSVPSSGPCIQYAYDTNGYGEIIGSVINPMPAYTGDEFYTTNILINIQTSTLKGVFTYCPEDYENVTHLYLYVSSSLESSTWLWIDSSPDAKILRPITEMSPFQFMFETYLSTRVECDDLNVPMLYYYREANGYWPVFPSEDPIPFYPRPYPTFSVAKFNNIQLLRIPQAVPRKFAGAVLLSYKNLDVTKPDTVFLTAEQFKTCKLIFQGTIANASGDFIVTAVSDFHPKNITCNPAKYSELALENKRDLEMLSSSSGQNLTDMRFTLDVQSMSETWLACKQLASSLFTVKHQVVNTYGSICAHLPNETAYETDPCCNPTAAWEGPNCAERPISLIVDTYDQPSDEQASLCSNLECSEIFARDYQALTENLDSPLTGCAVNTEDISVFSGKLLLPYRTCRDQYFGADQSQGVPCTQDSDCDSGYKCDLIRKACLYPVERQTRLFLECLLPKLDGYIVEYIEKSSNIAHVPPSQRGSAAYIAAWIDALSDQDCTGTFTLALSYRSHYIRSYSREGLNWEDCDWCPETECLDEYCSLPFECQTRFGEGCYKSYRPFSGVAMNTCLNARVCNWNATITDEDECANPSGGTGTEHFCAYCETNESPCVEVEASSQAECQSGVACVLADGSIIVAADEDECQNTYACTVDCWDPVTNTFRPCHNESECLSSGHCEDRDYLDGKYNGVCVAPNYPYRIWDCYDNEDYLYDPIIVSLKDIRPAPSGCILYPITNETYCESKGGVIEYPATNEAECLAKGFGCRETFHSYTYLMPEIHTFKSERDCNAAGGVYEPIYKWTPGQWRGGQARSLQWLTREMRPLNYNYTKTFNFFRLNNLLNAAITEKYSYMVRSDSQCRYNRVTDLLENIACNCGAGNINEEDEHERQTFESFCRPKLSVIPVIDDGTGDAGDDYTSVNTIATTVICPGFPEQIIAPPARLFFESDSILGDRCTEIVLGAVAAGSQRYDVDLLPSFLLNFYEDSEWQFRNKKRALVGQIVSDGMSISFNSDGEVRAALCLSKRPDIGLKNSKYVVPDFAVSTEGERDLMALHLNITTNARNEFCANLTIQPNVIYWAVLRLENDEDVNREIFPPVETGLYSISIIIYLIIMGFSIYILITTCRFENTRDKSVKNKIGLCIIIIALCLARSLYLALVVSGVFIDNASNAVSFVFIELPSFFYFTTLTFFIVVWSVALRAMAKRGTSNFRKNFLRMFFGVNIAMYGIFILLIILYEAIKGENTQACGGAIIHVDTSTRQRIAVAYRSIVTIIASLIAITFLTLGARFHMHTMKMRSVSYKRKETNNRLFVMTIVCSVALVIQAVFLLALAASGYQNNVLTMCFLLGFEALPCCFILAVFARTDARTIAQSTVTYSKSSPMSTKTTKSAVKSDTV